MSSRTNNITQTPWDWYSDDTYSRGSSNNRSYRRMPTLSQFLRPASLSRPEDTSRRAVLDTWRPTIEERALTGPLGLAGFPVQPPAVSSPMQVLILDSTGVGRDHDQLPALRLTGQRSMQASASTQADSSRTTQLLAEQNKALKQLKKETYNPIPKRITRRLSLYYRDRSMDNLKAEKAAKDTEDDGKRCAVCLEDFEPKESVMLTPCNHMFHEECIVPWVKSNGQCPVCRFVLCDRPRGSAAPAANIESFAANDIFEGELISVIRAMEEAFVRGNTSRW